MFAPLSQEAGTFCKGNTRLFLEKGTSRLNTLLGFLHPGSRASRCPGRARAPADSPHAGAAGTPVSQLPRQKEAPSLPPRAKWKRGTKQNLPRLTHLEAPPGGEGDDFRLLPGSFALSGLGQGTRDGRTARWADPSLQGTQARSGQERSPPRVHGKQPERNRQRAHLGEEVVHCSSAFPHLPESGVQLAEVSPAEGPGKPCVSRRDSQELKPSGLPRCHRLILFSSFAPFVCPNPIL